MFFYAYKYDGFLFFCNQKTFCTAFMSLSWFLTTNGQLLPVLLCIGLMIRKDHFYCILVCVVLYRILHTRQALQNPVSLSLQWSPDYAT
jgi:hypothetical protein